MKVFTFVSPSHEPLLSGWLRSTLVDPQLAPVPELIGIPSDGDYGNDQWKPIATLAAQKWRDVVAEHMGEVVMLTGVDVRFLKPFVDDSTKLMEGHDILMQRERADLDLLNPDVSFWRCSHQVVDAIDRLLLLLPSWDGHLPHQNMLMRTAFTDITVGLLPSRYACTDNPDPDPVLFHANCTPPPGSVRKKLDMLARFEP